MGKLQPNFSWQKYEGKPEDQREQFQYQLQTQHIQVANTVNTTIDDSSYFTTERVTGFTWIDSKPIWTKTITGTIVGTMATPYAHGISNIDVVISCTATASLKIAGAFSKAIFIPYIDPTNLAAGVGIYIDPTNVTINAGDNGFNNYPFFATILYTKL